MAFARDGGFGHGCSLSNPRARLRVLGRESDTQLTRGPSWERPPMSRRRERCPRGFCFSWRHMQFRPRFDRNASERENFSGQGRGVGQSSAWFHVGRARGPAIGAGRSSVRRLDYVSGSRRRRFRGRTVRALGRGKWRRGDQYRSADCVIALAWRGGNRDALNESTRC